MLSFPKFGHPGPAWLALVPLLVVLARCGAGSRAPVRAFTLGLATGAVYFTGTLYWITDVMVTFGGLARPVAVLVNAALVAFLALYPGVFGVAVAALVARLGPGALLLSPAVWVTTELGRGTLFTGFPWVLLGYSQAGVLPVAQVASLGGVLALSGLVALVSAALAYAVLVRNRRGVAAVVVTAALVAGAATWGAWRVRDGTLLREGDRMTVGLVQANVAQEDKWNPALAGEIFRSYLEMSREAAGRGARFIIWPESATPFFYEEQPAGRAAIEELARDTGAWLLFGSDQIERNNGIRYYNAAFLVTPQGATSSVYRKIHLVPFGEYVPLRRVFFFAEPLVESVADFSPGTEAVILPVGTGRASTAICYEVVYPGLIRRSVTGGSQLLTTITNDAWYGWSSAPWQHFSQAAVRSIEQGRYLVRAANTGVSGIVDPYGRVVAQSEIFERAVLVGEVAFLDGMTLYGRTGDVFAYGCGAATLGALLATWRRRWKPVWDAPGV